MTGIATEALIVVLLIIANGVFALAEVAVVSARKARLIHRAERGNSGAKVALDLVESPNRFLSTVQIGITLIGILAGALGGATISRELAESFREIEWLAPYADTVSLGLVVLAITYLSLVIGELVPKRIGLNDPERVASTVAKPMRALSVISMPLVWLLSKSTNLVLRLLRINSVEQPPVTEEEIKVMLEQGTRAGVFFEAENDMVQRIFRLDDRFVNSIMTNRSEVDWLNLDASWEENLRRLSASDHSRLPVCRGSLDEVVGMVRAKDLLRQSLTGEPIDLATSLEAPVFVPETMQALKLLELLKMRHSHIAVVVDEFGVTQGLVTLHDFFEAIVGDVPEYAEEPLAFRREDRSWLLDGIIPIDEMRETLQMDELPGESSGSFQTLAGFVLTYLGRIPTTGNTFEVNGYRFEVMDMDGPRIDKVLVKPIDGTEDAIEARDPIHREDREARS